jgi:hypothetical protein
MIGFVLNALASFTGSVLAPALQESLQHQTDISFDSLKAEFIDRLRARFGRPGNHDIARAMRVAELQATEHLLRGYDKLCETLKSGGEVIDREQDSPAFIAAVHKYLNGAFRKRLAVELTDRHLDTEPTFVAREIAAGTGTLGDPSSSEEYVLLAAVEVELQERTGWKPLPRRFADIMRRGEGEIPSWLTAFRAFLAEQIKLNRRFREILQTVLLFQIRAEQQEGRADITAEISKRIDAAITEQQRMSFGKLGEQFNSVERQITDLHGSLENYLLTFGNLDTRLVRLLEDANDPEQLCAAVQRTLDQAYRHIGAEALIGSQQVLREYEGPLFGRRASFEMLDRFLANHDRGILLITAPAGLGKSALLETWSSSIAGPDLTMVRHFFSARRPDASGRSDMVRSLVRQIAMALGPEALGGGVPGDSADLADRLAMCLREDRPAGTSLVVVLDSLDEAAERIEPLASGKLGRGCYVVASGRANESEQPAFLNRWRELAHSRTCAFSEATLAPLDREDIESWLGAASELPITAGVGDRVWRASEGVPLFASFLVSDAISRLHHSRIARGNDDVPESFVAYAGRELQSLRDLWVFQIERLFALLAIVKGPIGSADISAIIGDFTLSGSRIDSRIQRWFSAIAQANLGLLYAQRARRRPVAELGIGNRRVRRCTFGFNEGEQSGRVGRRADAPRRCLPGPSCRRPLRKPGTPASLDLAKACTKLI